MISATPGRPSLFASVDRPFFEEVVVPLIGDDLGDRGLAVAIDYAERLSLPIRLVTVANAAGPPGGDTKAADALERARTRVAANHPGVEVAADLTSALDVASGLTSALHRDSLVVLATQHAGADDGSFSVAEGLVSHWDGMVVMVGPDALAADLPGPVVVPLDGSPSGRHALTGCLALTGVWEGPVWLLHVVDTATHTKMAELREAGYAISENVFVKELADELTDSGQPAGWEIVHDDDPVRAIIDFAHQRGAALIAIGTHGAGRTSRTFGSVSMRIVHEAPVPVAVMGSSSGLP